MTRMSPQDWTDKVALKVMDWYEKLDDYPATFTVTEAAEAIGIKSTWVRVSIFQLLRQDKLKGHLAQELFGRDGCDDLGISPDLAMYNVPKIEVY